MIIVVLQIPLIVIIRSEATLLLSPSIRPKTFWPDYFSVLDYHKFPNFNYRAKSMKKGCVYKDIL